MNCKLFVGQKVVCINDDPDAFNLPDIAYNNERELDGLTKNSVYTVRDIFIAPLTYQITVLLNELIRPPFEGYNDVFRVESGWHYSRFKPLETRKTDITIFTDMLNKKVEWIEYAN